MSKEPASKVLAQNVEMLMQREGIPVGALAERSGISLRTLANVRANKNATIDTVEAIAAVFKLSAAQLLSPTLESELADPKAFADLKRVYSATTADGRDVVQKALKVAEAMSKYR